MKRKPAEGGRVSGANGSPTTDDIPFLLSRACCVVSNRALAEYGREFFEAMNGGNTDVISASEALSAMDDDDA